MEISRKERIEILEGMVTERAYILAECVDNELDQDEHNQASKEHEALSSAIAEAELMERVASGGVRKREVFCNTYKPGVDCPEVSKEYLLGFNEAVDLCNAHRATQILKEEEIFSAIFCFLDTEKRWQFEKQLKLAAHYLYERQFSDSHTCSKCRDL